jgi:DNA-binding LacI/PurR family transcriptional regulator
MKPGRRHPSSTDVARLAGVSPSAVSRAFSEGKSVSPETSRKVFAAAKKLGYSPNFIPRILRKHRSHLVAIVVNGTDNPFYAMTLEEFTRSLQNAGYHVLLVHVDGPHALDGALPRLASYRVDAIVSALPVLSAETARAFARIRIPTVAFNTPVKNRYVASVCCDNAGAAGAVADLFVARGARRFGFIAGSEGSHASDERLRGYRERLAAQGFPHVAAARGDFLYRGGHDAALALLAAAPPPDAIFCANDLMAIGAIDALRRTAGIRVPEDVLIAGFDDVPEASWAAYDLTTVVQEAPAMVAAALAILEAMMASGASRGGVRKVVPGRLVERATTRR